MKGLLIIALVGQLLSLGAAQWTVDPPTDADPDTVADCTLWYVAEAGDSCKEIAAAWALTLADFQSYNPSVGTSCNLIEGNSYCVERNWGVPPEVPTVTTSSIPPTSTGNGVSTPTPTQMGMTPNCNKFYFVKIGDSCAVIASDNSIALADFYAWNPAVKGDCSGLWANVYVCVGIIGGPTTTTTSPMTATSAGNGITTPTPTQAGMTSNCNKFYFVQSGDGCAAIASNNDISLSNFYTWNPAVKSDCSGLWANVYVCVGTIGGPTTTTTSPITTTSAGNGITTPTPTQAGMTSNCNKFYFVKSGDGCAVIASNNGISLSNFYTWNPAVKSDCSGLWANVYVCVGIIGSIPTTTTKNNGIATPTPTQSGMVGNCDGFHKVVGGDSCYDIAANAGISLSDFYAWNPAVGGNCGSLWLGYYVCVSLI